MGTMLTSVTMSQPWRCLLFRNGVSNLPRLRKNDLERGEGYLTYQGQSEPLARSGFVSRVAAPYGTGSSSLTWALTMAVSVTPTLTRRILSRCIFLVRLTSFASSSSRKGEKR